MNIKYWKWWTIANVGILSLIIGEYFFGIIDFLIKSDATYLSFAIISIAVIFTASTFINYRNVSEHPEENSLYWYCTDVVLSIGMMGTLIGFLIVLGQAFTDIDPSSIASMTEAITVLATGMSTALVTTLVGLIASVWMKLQLVIVES